MGHGESSTPIPMGTELCQSIKTNPRVRRVPVMLLSACADTPERASACGAEDCLIKPYSITELCEKVALLLVGQPLVVAQVPRASIATGGVD